MLNGKMFSDMFLHIALEFSISKEFPHNESLKPVDFSGVKVETLQIHEQHKKMHCVHFLQTLQLNMPRLIVKLEAGLQN